jgi:hypothetical protein
MAKLSFTKLGLKPNSEIVNIVYGDLTIEVKQYLSVEEKLEIITNVLELSHDSNNFSNPIKVQVYTALEMIDRYTNISFTEKQKENPTKLYDLLNGNGLIEKIIGVIPQTEYDELIHGIYDSIDAVYSYQNSVLGILDTVSQDYSNLNLEATEIQKKLADPNNMELLKGIMTKLG